MTEAPFTAYNDPLSTNAFLSVDIRRSSDFGNTAEHRLSVQESCLAPPSHAGGGRRGSRRPSRRSSIASSHQTRLPLHVEEVASRIDDAGEGTLVDWPWPQEPVERHPNPHLTEDEIKRQYGSRMQPYLPDHDVSDDEHSQSKGVRSSTPSSGGGNRRRIHTNEDLVQATKAARTRLKARLREENLTNRCVKIVQQWKSRIVDTAPQKNAQLDGSEFVFDEVIDPAILHQKAMSSILDEEKQIADQLIVMFQKMAREAEEMRLKREFEEEQQIIMASQTLPKLRQVDETMSSLLDPWRKVDNRIPLVSRLTFNEGHDKTPEAPSPRSTVVSPSHLAEQGTQLLPKITIAQQSARNNNKDRKANVQPEAPPVFSVPSSREGRGKKQESPRRRAPWASGLPSDVVGAAPRGFEDTMMTNSSVADSVNGSKPPVRIAEHLRAGGYIPSTSDQIDETVKNMVSASNSGAIKRRGSRYHDFGGTLEGTTERASRGVVVVPPPPSHGGILVKIEADSKSATAPAAGGENATIKRVSNSPTELPAEWFEMRIPSDPTLLSELHSRLVHDAQKQFNISPPPELMCPVSGMLMTEPVLVSDPTSAGPEGGTILEASLDRETWMQLLDAVRDRMLRARKLPFPLNLLLATDDVSSLRVRTDSRKLKDVVAWRSSALYLLATRAMQQKARDECIRQVISDALDGFFKVRGWTREVKSEVEKRRRFSVDMPHARFEAFDALKKINEGKEKMEAIRQAVPTVLQSIDALNAKRGVAERDLLRLQIRISRAEDRDQRETAQKDARVVHNVLSALDHEVEEQGSLLLDMDRRFVMLRVERVTAERVCNTFNRNVSAYNAFVTEQRKVWGPMYKASICACYSVVKQLFDRELTVRPENKDVLRKVADYLGETSVKALQANLPQHVIQLENKMKACKLPLNVVPITDAAFVLLAPDAQFEDTLPFEPMVPLQYPCVELEPPSIAFKAADTASGLDLLRRGSIKLPLPPPSKGHRGGGAPKIAPKMELKASGELYERPPGTNPDVPFWHFVRQKGDSQKGAAHQPQGGISSLALKGTQTGSNGQETKGPTQAKLLKSRDNTDDNHNENDQPYTQQFLASKIVHMRRLRRKLLGADGGAMFHPSTAYPQPPQPRSPTFHNSGPSNLAIM